MTMKSFDEVLIFVFVFIVFFLIELFSADVRRHHHHGLRLRGLLRHRRD
jgi:hypothetical protein